MNSIPQYIQNMYFYIGLIFSIIILIQYVLFRRLKENAGFIHEIGITLFFTFLAGLLSLTIYPAGGFGQMMFAGDYLEINLEPFRVFETYNAIKYFDLWQPFLINFVGNIVMFIPVGLFLPLLWKKFNCAWRVIRVGFFLSLAIEILQLPQLRYSDVDDLWLNTLGTYLGYVLFKCLPKKFKKSFLSKRTNGKK